MEKDKMRTKEQKIKHALYMRQYNAIPKNKKKKQLRNKKYYSIAKNIKNKKLLTIEEITDNWYKKLIQIKIICEPKFQISVNIPDKLYHVSDIKFKEKIFKIGLIPKSLGKNSNHPDRIYCSNSLKDCYKLINTFKLKNIKRTDGTKYCIFEIDSQNLTTSNYKNEVEKVQFFEDINFKEYGVFTYCNIHPKYLQIVDDNI